MCLAPHLRRRSYLQPIFALLVSKLNGEIQSSRLFRGWGLCIGSPNVAYLYLGLFSHGAIWWQQQGRITKNLYQSWIEKWRTTKAVLASLVQNYTTLHCFFPNYQAGKTGRGLLKWQMAAFDHYTLTCIAALKLVSRNHSPVAINCLVSSSLSMVLFWSISVWMRLKSVSH